MRLRGRFTIWFALAAVLPIAAAAIGTRQVLSDNYREAYELRQKSAESLASLELDRVKARVAASVGSLARVRQKPAEGVDVPVQEDSFFIGGLLTELEKSDGRLEQLALRRLREQGRVLMGAVGLDVVLLLDPGAMVLFAPHYHPAEQQADRSRPTRAELAARTQGRSFFAREPIIVGGQIRQPLVVESIRTVSKGRRQVTVVGGQVIDRD